jgi:hypothetical protein
MMTVAKVCLAVLVCVPMAVIAYKLLKKIVDEIR